MHAVTRARRVVLRLTALAALVAAARPIGTTPTVWLAGDSTMAPKLATRRPETGWGEMLPRFVRDSSLRIANHAVNGRSTRSFIAEGRWQRIVDSLRAGDYVVIQFGHNDESVEKVDRYTAPADYAANLRRMVGDVRARGGTPLLFTPVSRRKFDPAGALVDTHGAYPDSVRAVAAELRVPLVDMHRGSRDVLSRLGRDSSATLFLQLEKGESPNYPDGVHDNTHFRPRGALAMARLAVAGLREAVPALAPLLAPADAPVDSAAVVTAAPIR